MGDFEQYSDHDIKHSLELCYKWRIGGNKVLDVGGGSSRVSHGVLRHLF
jgi:ubiquinone/menaquinone biosynthesis C-methylase UbiE